MTQLLAVLYGGGTLAALGAIIYLAVQLVASKNAESDAREKLAALEVTQANAATAAAADAEKRQEKRGDDLEREIDAPHPAGATGLDRLRSEVPDPGPAGPGRAGG